MEAHQASSKSWATNPNLPRAHAGRGQIRGPNGTHKGKARPHGATSSAPAQSAQALSATAGDALPGTAEKADLVADADGRLEKFFCSGSAGSPVRTQAPKATTKDCRQREGAKGEKRDELPLHQRATPLLPNLQRPPVRGKTLQTIGSGGASRGEERESSGFGVLADQGVFHLSYTQKMTTAKSTTDEEAEKRNRP
ncbi:hypothetical protein AXF42_Ash021462 [Apostasia shenzhenica]|uniref:Uncharacterized protein n=1 Tax=Apostasia shenzhenica TaxID=1088818 RepID=A0A2H9ZVR2_9ASPA|nr:hypothetical protein AXF42_Ash021462 [Apostasia shenzhenica]